MFSIQRENINSLPKAVEIVLNDYFRVFNMNLPGLMDSFYLIGSIVLDDYHEGKSDIDFVCVINRDITSEELKLVKKIHKEIRSKYSKKVLEGFYVTSQQIGKLNNDINQVIYFDGKKVGYEGKSGNVSIITWFMLKNYGMTLVGKQPDHYALNIDVEDLINYVKLNADTYWVNWTEQASKNLSINGVFTLFEQGVEWGVLGISRLYYTIHENDIASKYEAGKYVLDKIPTHHERIIREALRIRKAENESSYYKSPFRRRRDSLLFMRYMINQF